MYLFPTSLIIKWFFYDTGLLWMECKQMYSSGVRIYLLDNYNWVDYTVLSLYLSSYVLRFLVDHWIKDADLYYNGTARAWEALEDHNVTMFRLIRDEMFYDLHEPVKSYFMKACKYTINYTAQERLRQLCFNVGTASWTLG